LPIGINDHFENFESRSQLVLFAINAMGQNRLCDDQTSKGYIVIIFDKSFQ